MSHPSPHPVGSPVEAADDVRGLDRSGLARCAGAVASLGAGLVAAAVAGPAVRDGLLVPAAALTALAAWQLGWALAALAADRVPAPRAAVAVLALGAAGWLVSTVAPPLALVAADLPAVLAAAMSLAAAALAVLGLRWSAAPGSPSGRWSQIAVLALAGFAVAGAATPALAATEAGGRASHGGHVEPAPTAPGAGQSGHAH